MTMSVCSVGPMEAGRKVDDRLIRIKGIVIPFQWDSAGNVTALAISTAAEEEYLVHDDDKGRELQNFMQEAMEVSGRVKETGGPLKRISVMDYCQAKLEAV